MNVNVNLMIENVTQIKTRITIIVDMNVKVLENMCVKNIIFGILAHVLVKKVHI